LRIDSIMQLIRPPSPGEASHAPDVPFANSDSGVVEQGAGAFFEGTGATPSTSTFTAAAGTSLRLGGLALTTSSVAASDGFVTISNSTEAGTYSAAGGT
jgi:hypothetical protein